MRRVLVVAWGQTEWEAQGRLTGNIDLSLSRDGRAQAEGEAGEIAAYPVKTCYSGPEEAARETCGIIAKRLGLRPHKMKDLHEMDLGHWEGLTDGQFRERFPSVYRQWHEDPTAVVPPEGEALADAASRLEKAAMKAVRKTDEGDVLIVTGPLAAAALRLRLEGAPLGEWWSRMEEKRRWAAIDITSRLPKPTGGESA